MPILVILSVKCAYYPCFILNFRKPLCFPMHFLIVFLCLKREGQGKLLGYSDKYMNNGEILGKNDRKRVFIMQKVLRKRTGKSLYYAESTKNGSEKGKKKDAT